MLSYAARRCGQALLTFALLAVAVALLTTGGARGGGSALDWLAAAVRLDFGRASDNSPVIVAIAAGLPATALLVLAATLIGLSAGYGGGLLLALTDPALSPRTHLRRPRATPTLPGGETLALSGETSEQRGEPPALPGRAGDELRALWYAPVRALAIVVDACQGVPVFWLGGVLVVVLSVGLGLFPPGGIADPALPAFGTASYLDLLRVRPALVLGDLLGHLTLPALTLALAGLSWRLRLVSTALSPELRAPYARVARAAGLSRRRLAWRAGRPALPVIMSGAVGNLAPLAGALVLVEYLFGWPGLGLLAYHAARSGDVTTLGTLLLLFGFVVIVAGLVVDIAAAWADPRLRSRGMAP